MRTRSLMLSITALALVVGVSAGQTVVYFPDNVPGSGAQNLFPYATSAYTTQCVYPAATLAAAGVQSNMILTDLAVSPFPGVASGTLVATQAKNWIGNMVAAPVPNGWVANLNGPTLMWDSSVDGNLTFPWTASAWSSIPIRQGAQFSWDGVHDIGVQLSRGPTVTGGFSVYTSPTNSYTRHGTTSFDPIPGTATTTTGVLGFRIRMTFAISYHIDTTTTGNGVGDLNFVVTNVPPGTAEGFTLITTATTSALGVGPFFGIDPDGLTINVILTPAAPGNPLHWLAGFPGLFPDTPIFAPPGTLSFLSGQTWRFVGVALGPGLTYLGRSNATQVAW